MKRNTLFHKAGTELARQMKKANSKITAAGIFFMMTFVIGSTNALAVGDFFEELGSSFTTIYGSLVAFSPMVAGLAYVAAKIWQIVIPEKQGRVEPKEWARSALFNYFLILAAGGILGFIAKAASNLSD